MDDLNKNIFHLIITYNINDITKPQIIFPVELFKSTKII